MKYASYILSIIAVVLIFNIFLSYSSSGYRGFLRETKNRFVGVDKTEVIEKLSKDQIEINTKILNSIDKLNENLEKETQDRKKDLLDIEMKKVNEIDTKTGSTLTLTGDDAIESTGSLEKENIVSKAKKIEIPGTLLIKLLPQFNPKKLPNAGVFGIKENKFFDKFEYVFYRDLKKKVSIYVFDSGYGQMLSELKMVNVYKVNESDTFFGFTFFLNPLKKDDKVRFVTQLEGVAVGFELDKSSYESLKKSLLK